jgi:Tfp pilus assembly protein PilF
MLGDDRSASSTPAASASEIGARLAQAEAALAAGRIDVAQREYAEVLKLDPGNARARLGGGETFLRTDQYQQAVSVFAALLGDKALGDDKLLRAKAAEGLGMAYLKGGRPDQAVSHLRDAVGADPSLWQAWNGLGFYHAGRAEWPAAEDSYQRALQAEPDIAAVESNLGSALLTQSKFVSAEAHLHRAVKLDPQLAVAQGNLRLAQAWQGKYAEALTGISEKELPSALNNVGVVAMRRGDYEAAEQYLARAMETSPTYAADAAENLKKLRALKAGSPAAGTAAGAASGAPSAP